MKDYNYADYAAEFKRRMGVFWDRAESFAAETGPPPETPWQVEIHPAPFKEAPCPWRCVDCHGQFMRTRGGVTTEQYFELVNELLTMGVPSVVYSGAYSDPSTDPELLAGLLDRGGHRWGVKLHMFGHGLTERVRRSIVEAARRDPNRDSYVTLSRLTRDPEAFRAIYRPHSDPAEVLRVEESQVDALLKEVAEAGVQDRLSVNITCRITRINGKPELLADLLRWFSGTPDFTRLRVTTDYEPSRAPDKYKAKFLNDIYMPFHEADDVLGQALRLAAVTPLNPLLDRIVFRDPEASEYGGDRCYHALLMATIGADGRAYPCPPVAGRGNEHLSYGDVAAEPFRDCWQRLTSTWHQGWDPIAGGCPHCVAACEKHLNCALDHVVQPSFSV